MEITIMLASIWGPVLLAVGLGFFISPDFYRRVYRDIEKQPFAVIFFGIVAMAVGVLHVQIHNVWDDAAQIIVSLVGWGFILKGAASLIVPKSAERWGDWAVNTKLVPVVGVFPLVLGAYLTWLAYFV